MQKAKEISLTDRVNVKNVFDSLDLRCKLDLNGHPTQLVKLILFGFIEVLSI